MVNKSDIREIIRIGVILFAITALAACVLALMNSVTAPVIAKNQAEKQALAMQVVLPTADGFADQNLKTETMPATITAVYQSTNDAGYAVMVSPNGYGGAISMAVGVSPEGVVTGVDIVSQTETAGLGTNCTKPEFKEQFLGKTAGITVVKSGAKDNQIDAISSATVTSKAVTAGVNAAIEAVESIEKEGVGNAE